MQRLSTQYAKRLIGDDFGETLSLENDLTNLEALFGELQEECSAMESLTDAESILREHPEYASSVESMIDDYLDQNEIVPSMEEEKVEADGKVRSVIRRVWKAIIELIKKIGRAIHQLFYKLFTNQERIKQRASRRVDKLKKSRKPSSDKADFKVMPVIAQWVNEKPFTANTKYPALDMRKLAIAVSSSANRVSALGKYASGEREDTIKGIFERYLKDIHTALNGLFVPYKGLAKNNRAESVDPSSIDAKNSLGLLQSFREDMKIIRITLDVREDRMFNVSRGEVLVEAEKLKSEISRLDSDMDFSKKTMEKAIHSLEDLIDDLKDRDTKSDSSTPWAQCVTSMLHITQFASMSALRSAVMLSKYHENVGRYLDTAIHNL